MDSVKFIRIVIIAAALFLPSSQIFGKEVKNDAIIIGLDADLSSGSAESGESIRRGIVLAINEINNTGGVLGRPLELVSMDHRGNPARGIDNIKTFAQKENLVAVVGGLHTPVALAELEQIHRHRIIYLGPWAAGTPIIDNGFDPNYAFRISVRDEYAGGYLVKEAMRSGYRRLGLLLEQTGWGKSNRRAMEAALKTNGLEPVGIQWFLWGVKDLTNQINHLREAGADVIMLVANAPEGIAAVRSMAALPQNHRLPIMSHWGITGGVFFQKACKSLPKVDLQFLQTFSFAAPPFPKRARRIFEAYQKQFPDTRTTFDIFSPVGTAHAYDLVHILRLAIKKAGTIDRPAVRDALETIEVYQGLVRNYRPPFTAKNHDALDSNDFRLAIYNEKGHIVSIPRGQ